MLGLRSVYALRGRVFSSQTRLDNEERQKERERERKRACFTTRKRHLTKRLEKFSHVDCASLFLARSTLGFSNRRKQRSAI